MSLRVLHLITELSTGGAQVALLRLIERLDRGKYDIQVACLYNGKREIAEKIRGMGIEVTDLGMTSKWDWFAFLRLCNLLRKFQPHILHTWLFHANVPGCVFGRLNKTPIIISSEHSMGRTKHWRIWLSQLAGRLADRIVCVSEIVEEHAIRNLRLPLEKFMVIPNGIDPSFLEHQPTKETARRKMELPENSLLIGSIGRAHPAKGFDILIHAFQQLSSEFPSAYLVIAGDGPQLEALQDQAKRTNQPGKIIFLGNIDDTRTFLAALDIYVQPSRYEGLPLSVLEAMAAGLPVVASDVGGIPEIIKHNQTGLFFPAQNIELLSESVRELIIDYVKRIRLGTAARHFVFQNYSLTSTVAKTEALYHELTQSKLDDLPN